MSPYDEIIPVPNNEETKQKVLQLYDQRINRYKMRLSAMYPDNGCAQTAGFGQIRTTSMMNILSYMDTPSQLELKKVSRFFQKMVKISQTDVSVNAMEGWIDAIHLSTFLQRLVLAGEPKEEDLQEFVALLQNDGYLQLKTLELYLVGECALLEILSAIATRVDRESSLGLLSEDFRLNLVIQEKELSPYFASRFASLVNSSLCRILTNITFICSLQGSVPLLLQDTQFGRCPYLTEVYLNGIPLGRSGVMALFSSLWPSDPLAPLSPHAAPALSRLFLSDTGVGDTCVAKLASAVESGLLTSLEYLDLSRNAITAHGMARVVHFLNAYMCPNLKYVKVSENPRLSEGCLAAWFRGLCEGTAPCLKVIEVNDCGLNSADFEALGAFFRSEWSAHITQLDVGNNRVGDEGVVPFLRCLRGVSELMSGVAELISGSEMEVNSPSEMEVYSPSEVESRSEGEPHAELESLNLEGTNLSSEGVAELSRWLSGSKTSRLHRLVLRNNLIGGQDLLTLFSALQQSCIQCFSELDLSGNGIQDLDKKRWEAATRTPSHVLQVKHFSLARNPYNNDDFAIVVGWLSKHTDVHSLTQIDFEDNCITTKGVAAFLDIFPTEVEGRLDSFTIFSTSIRTIGATLHKWLRSPSAAHLRTLQLVNCNLCKNDLAYLVHAFKTSHFCQGIQYLRLSGNHDVDDVFVRDFIDVYEAGYLSHLEKLDLSYTAISKKGAYAFLSFFQRASEYSLALLNICYTSIPRKREQQILREFRRVFKGGCVI